MLNKDYHKASVHYSHMVIHFGFFSAEDDFEEITLGDSGEDSLKESSVEEIDLMDLEETHGTKRCACQCHEGGDDTFKKRKKHCYKCCLTVSINTSTWCSSCMY